MLLEKTRSIPSCLRDIIDPTQLHNNFAMAIDRIPDKPDFTVATAPLLHSSLSTARVSVRLFPLEFV
jgi:hypothetical protein